MGDDAAAKVVGKIKEKWNGNDFSGTDCNYLGKPECIDDFKDAMILISIVQDAIMLTNYEIAATPQFGR